MLIFINTRETDVPVIFLIEKKGKGYWQEFNQTLERDKLNWAWYKHSTLKDRYKTSRHTGNETSSQKFSTWYTGGHGPQNGLFYVKAFFMFFFGQTLGSHMASPQKRNNTNSNLRDNTVFIKYTTKFLSHSLPLQVTKHLPTSSHGQ